MIQYLSFAAVILAITYQIYVSRLVLKSIEHTKRQRQLQVLLIWLLPVVGAVVCQAMLREPKGLGSAADVLGNDLNDNLIHSDDIHSGDGDH